MFIYVKHLTFAVWLGSKNKTSKAGVSWTVRFLNATVNSLDQSQGNNPSILGLIFQIIFIPLLSHATSLYSMSRLVIMIFILTLFPLARKFDKLLKEESRVKPVVEMYDSMRKIVEAAQNWTNWLVMLHYIGILSFLAYTPALRTSGQGMANWYFVNTYIIYGTFLIAACEMTNRVAETELRFF